ncbi:MAG: tetratricopeptide repeat protein [candidate division KSB1 bacterium]|nr:tetratricopeptide repeat protein [candidate division KSB1 bacterium]MDZ7304102.1 tetratricopeptide repeat protein [candidate division KSB1 bacterium]MDZ7312082.1 tetratricopeptide repeat protein [candidate division KSB1 bacterium]
MQQLGLNNDVLVGGRRFHVQTTYSASSEKIISHIFDNGRVIERREVAVNDEGMDSALPKKLKVIHQEMISEIELLYYIAEKVRQVQHPLSCVKLGLVFMNRNLLDDAMTFFQLATELDPNAPEHYSHLGYVNLRLRDFATAEHVLRKGLQLAPRFADLHHHLGVACLEQGKFPQALESLQTAIDINPNFFQAHFHRALALLSQMTSNGATIDATGFLPAKQAQEHLTHAAEGLPAYRTPRLEKAMQLIDEGAYAQATQELQSLRQEINTETDLTFEHEFYLKFMYGGKGKDDDFIQRYAEQLRTAIHEYPDYADLHNSLGVAYLIQCRNLFLRALEEFRVSLRINPGYKRAEKNLKLSENDGKGFLILLRAILK